MRKVRLAINVSLDGYVARPNGELDWIFHTMTPDDTLRERRDPSHLAKSLKQEELRQAHQNRQ